MFNVVLFNLLVTVMSTQTQADSTISYPDDDNVIATASSTGDNTTTNEVELDGNFRFFFFFNAFPQN